MSPATLADRRRDAQAAYEQLPMPTLRDENWRYTSLRGIDFGGFRPERPRVELSADALPAGVVFGDLAQAIDEHPELVLPHLGSVVGDGRDRFVAENAATWQDGVLLYVPDGVEVTTPLRATLAIPSAGARSVARMLVIAGRGSRLRLIEELAEGEPGYLNTVVEIVVGDAANVEYVQAQQLHGETYHFSTQRAHIGRDATLDWIAIAIGGKLGKSYMESALLGSGGTSRTTGLYALAGDQHLDLDTRQEHRAPHAVSDLAFRGALLDKARSVWRGIIVVEEGAQKTDAFQENRNLMLSPRAHADSIPGLEIKANDVRCTHAATAGPIDRELLFFLMTRGLPRAEAQRMVVRGFFAETLARVADDELRDRISKSLEARIR